MATTASTAAPADGDATDNAAMPATLAAATASAIAVAPAPARA